LILFCIVISFMELDHSRYLPKDDSFQFVLRLAIRL